MKNNIVKIVRDYELVVLVINDKFITTFSYYVYPPTLSYKFSLVTNIFSYEEQ